MVFLKLKTNNPAIHKSINPSFCGMTVELLCFKSFREPLKIGIWRETGDYGEPTRSKRQEQPRCGL